MACRRGPGEPAMRLLNRYIGFTFLRFFGVGLAGCVGLFFLVELFDRMDEFIARQVLWSDAARYLLFRLPGVAYQLAPVAFLLASVMTFSRLTRGHEITAMRASGVSPLRLVVPLLGVGVLGGLLLLVAQEYLVPYTNQFSRLLWRTRIQREKMPTRLGLFKQGQLWYRTANRVWSIQLSDAVTQRLLGVTIFVLNDAGAISQRYDALEARQEATGWRLQQGTWRVFGPDGLSVRNVFTQHHVGFSERLADMAAVHKEPEEMSSREVLAYAEQLRHRGLPASRLLSEFYGRFAYAAACVIMAGFGIPLALRLNRSGGMMRAIGLTVFSGFGYWVVHSTAMALGANGQCPPLVAAWSTNICFGLGSGYLLYRLQ